MSGLAAVSGLLVVAGLLALVSGLRRSTPAASRRAGSPGASWSARWARLTRRPGGGRGVQRDVLLVVTVTAGFLVAAATGWVIAVFVVPALVVGLPYLLAARKPRDVEVLEALDRWVRSLAATLGTGKSVTDALRISRRTAPPLLAEEVEVLVARLNNRWDTRDALMRMADSLDSADADAVLAALILASKRGANGASVTLQALGDSLQATLKGRRVIEVERSKPYVVVRQVTVISLATLLVAFLLSPQFFDPYRTPAGQVILSVLVLAYAGSLLLMRRKAQQRPRPRVLVSGRG